MRDRKNVMVIVQNLGSDYEDETTVISKGINGQMKLIASTSI